MWALIDMETPDLSALAREFFSKLKLNFHICASISWTDHCQSLTDQNWSQAISHHLSCILSDDFALCIICTLHNLYFALVFCKIVHCASLGSVCVSFALCIILNFASFALCLNKRIFGRFSVLLHEAKVYSYILMTRRGYTGDALRVCLRGECFHDDECPNHLACFDYQVNLGTKTRA